MSSFSGLNTAASGLAAARRAMDVVGQNIVNQTTAGYTRQRVSTEAVGAIPNRFSTGVVAGQGVAVTGIERLGDAVLDARVRDTLAGSGFWSTRAVAVTTAEAALAEPTQDGLAARLSEFWAGWQDLANTPDSGAARAVVLESAGELAAHVAGGYRAIAAQWSDARAEVDRTVAHVNQTAEQIAALNRDIRDAQASGRPAHELVDRRNLLAQNLARTAGTTSRVEADGTMTVRIDGNALVAGVDARALRVSGPASVEDGARVHVQWEDAPDIPVAMSGGELGGLLSVLAPDADGGPLASLAATYNAVATTLASSVNALHGTGATFGGALGGEFFALAGTGPAALGLSVAVTDPADLALGAPGAGAHDASIADAISQLGRGTASPDRLWSDRVLSFAVATAGDVQRARQADATAVAATAAQQSVAAVDGDEETVSLVTYQAAYQAAARVITAVDEALDTVINRMGLVGR